MGAKIIWEGRMKILFIGGTGTISMAITKQLLADGQELYLLNRGNRNSALAAQLPGGEWNRPREIICDINNEEEAAEKLAGMTFDVVADFIAFEKWQLERDYRLFKGKVKQFIFISSAATYQKPCSDFMITESTPQCNPYWLYARNKIEGEEYMMKVYREEGFPVTIVRPSHTFDERNLPLGMHGDKGSWQICRRMLAGKPVIIHGDGTSLWTVTHNSDFAPGFIGLLGNPHALGQAVQIMSPESMTWNQIYETVADELGVELNAVHISTEFLAAAGGEQFDFGSPLFGDKAHTVVFDISKLQRLVPGYMPKKSMAQALRETVRNILEHPELQKEDPEFDEWCDRVIAARQAALDSLKKQ